MQKETIEKLKNDINFLEFVNREFNKTSNYATVEEIEEFAFGSLERAVKEYLTQNLVFLILRFPSDKAHVISVSPYLDGKS